MMVVIGMIIVLTSVLALNLKPSKSRESAAHRGLS
jgi:hypothetical protein